MTYNPNKALIKLVISLLCLFALGAYAAWLSQTDVEVNLLDRRQAPSWIHLFGTDNLGRDLGTEYSRNSDQLTNWHHSSRIERSDSTRDGKFILI